MQAHAEEMERQQAAFRQSIDLKKEKKKIVPTMVEPAPANVTTSDIGLKYNNRQKRGAMKNALQKIKSPTVLNRSRGVSMSSQDDDGEEHRENELLSNFLYSTKTMKVVPEVNEDMKSPTPDKGTWTFEGRSEKHYTYEATVKPRTLFDGTYEEKKE
jgi:hypothetical protein